MVSQSTVLWSNYYINTLRPEQNGCHFADDIFKYIFWYDFLIKFWNFITLEVHVFLKDPLTISQHWFRQWLGALFHKQQAITRIIVLISITLQSLAHNELNSIVFLLLKQFLQFRHSHPRTRHLTWWSNNIFHWNENVIWTKFSSLAVAVQPVEKICSNENFLGITWYSWYYRPLLWTGQSVQLLWMW